MARDIVTPATISRWLKDRPEHGERRVHRAAAGLDLRVYDSGPGAWFWRGRPRGLRPNGTRWPQQRIKLGDTGTMTLNAAITAAAALKAEIALGGDPAGDRRRAIASRIAARGSQDARKTALRAGAGPRARPDKAEDQDYQAQDYQVTSMRVRRDVLARVKLLAATEQSSMHWIIETALVAYLASRG